MSLGSLKAWLRKQPQPVAVMCDDRLVHVPKGVRCWTDLAKTVESIAPTQLTCLDKDGKVLRAKSFDAEKSAAGDDDAGDDAGDDDSTVGRFAKLIAAAYEKSTLHSGKLHETSMNFITRQGDALARAETECERLRLANTKLRGEIAQLLAELNAPTETPEGEPTVAQILLHSMLERQQREGGVVPITKGAKK